MFFSGDPPREECAGGFPPITWGNPAPNFYSVPASALTFWACAVRCCVVCLLVARFPALGKYFVV